MKRISLQHLNSAVFKTVAAAAVALVALPAAFADIDPSGLDKLLAEPTSFVAISEGAPGQVTFASMVGDTLAVQYSIPTHSGEVFGEMVGTVDDKGVFQGNNILIGDNGAGQSSPVTMTFGDDALIVADVKGGFTVSGFMTEEMYTQH